MEHEASQIALNFTLKNTAFSQNSVIINFLESENVPNDSLKMFDFGQHLPLIYKMRGGGGGKSNHFLFNQSSLENRRHKVTPNRAKS